MGIRIHFILAILVVAVIGGVLGLLVAKRRIRSADATAAPAPPSERKWPLYLVIGVLCIALLLMGRQIASLEDEIDALHSRISSDYAQLRTQINAIYSNVDEQLKKQASLVTSVEYQSGSYDEQTGRADVLLRITPKALSDDTAMSVSLDGETVALTREGDTFIGTLPIDLFYYDGYPLLSVTSDGTTQTEMLDSVYVHHLWTEYLPSVSGDLKGTRSTSLAKHALTVNATLSLDWQAAARNDEAYFVTAEIVTAINDREVERHDITADITSDIKGRITNGTLEAPFSHTYTYEGELETATVYLVATDSLGYVHELPLWHYLSSGMTAETVYGMETIRDAEGNVLYGKELQ